MKRAFFLGVLSLGLLALALVLDGCSDKDDRGTDGKLYAPAPEFATRSVMACSKCGAPQKPYRINGAKSFYRCTGQPPKFAFHPEEKWVHAISHDKDSTEQ